MKPFQQIQTHLDKDPILCCVLNFPIVLFCLYQICGSPLLFFVEYFIQLSSFFLVSCWIILEISSTAVELSWSSAAFLCALEWFSCFPGAVSANYFSFSSHNSISATRPSLDIPCGSLNFCQLQSLYSFCKSVTFQSRSFSIWLRSQYLHIQTSTYGLHYSRFTLNLWHLSSDARI